MGKIKKIKAFLNLESKGPANITDPRNLGAIIRSVAGIGAALPQGASSGNALAGMNCGTLTTNAPASMAMCRIDAIQPSLSSAVGASQICGPPW